jgi:preprotein translocase subunit SecY
VIGRIGNVFRVEEIRNRILVTVAFLLVYRIGAHIPIPGIDLELFKQAGDKEGGQFAALYALISGGTLYSPMLFGLGIMPYISSSIIFSLLAKVWPTLEKIAKEGASGQRKINQWTRLATVPLAAIQSAFIVGNIYRDPRAYGLQSPLLPGGFFLALEAILALTAGTLLLMWMGEQITEYGVGNGISLLIMAGIIARVPHAAAKLVTSETSPAMPVMLLILFFIVVVVVVYITKGTRKIPVQYAKLTRGRRVYGGQKHYLPIKVNQAGVMPVIFASALLSFPNILGTGLGWTWLQNAMTPASWTYTVLDVLLIYFFSFFWTSLMFNPVELSKNMKESGSFIPGIRPGKPTAEFLQRVMSRVTLAGATFLAVVAIIPQWIASSLAPQSPRIAYFLGGTSILIVVSVALDLVDKLNSALLMRSYEGFLRGSGGSGGGSRSRRR